MEPHGEGRLGILAVGEAPGAEEDAAGRPFIGNAGRFLAKGLQACGVDLDRDCWTTNAVQCQPPDNRDPTSAELGACAPRLAQQITDLKPALILALGSPAIGAVLRDALFTPTATLMHGRIVPSALWGCHVACGFHPSYYLHSKDYDTWQGRFLRNALARLDEPWSDPRLDEGAYEIVEDLTAATTLLKRLGASRTPVAVDFETTCLSPWTEGASVLTVGLAEDTTTGWCLPLGHIGACW